jgi:2-dehydropantoate 2-reductase
MKIVIIGAGGVGGYFGGRLAASGSDVTFIARGKHLAAMRESGLSIESPLGNLRIRPVNATDNPASVNSADLVVIAVKLWSTQEAIESAAPLMGPDTAIMSLQNGVDAADLLIARYGRARVLGGSAHIAAVIEAPGVIRHNGTLARITFGELDGGHTPRTEAFLAACRDAGIDVNLSDDIQRATWEKFVLLVGLSSLTSLTRLPIGPVREDPDTRALLLEVMQEVAAVGRAKRVALADDAAPRQLGFLDKVPHDMVSSMLGDLKRGNPLELDWLAGAVVRLGKEQGVSVPANRFVYAALKLHAAGRRPDG